ncbi:hypothetical protein LUZ63_012016 [Rhynchospora breviuscula]|uniref:KIB1-4 beta-propeller domain-containing protein n=1 Tax=Rhynchospora breviuscula TaxID=2022672 RepID=A0A9Q0CJZ4_9POAL|nr:hypothetical protein LUZ63_012016 [Rhynchospora breviuscula]
MTKRDWATLLIDLVVRIGLILLADDVTEFVRFRAVCRSWRSCAPNPKDLDSRFHPRKWIMYSSIDSPATTAFDFVNLSTGKKLLVDLTELRCGYSLIYVVDGLCLLKNNRTHMLALLNPFTRFLTHLPNRVSHNSRQFPFVLEHIAGILSGVYISSSSMVVLRFDIDDEEDSIHLVYAKPTDSMWIAIDIEIMPSDSFLYRDQFYMIDPNEGLTRINLHHEKNSHTQVTDVVVPCDRDFMDLDDCYLVECDGKFIMVAEIYDSPGHQMFRIDLEERNLVAIECIDGYALYLAAQRSLSIYCKSFWCAHDNCIYFCKRSHGRELMIVVDLKSDRFQSKLASTSEDPPNRCSLAQDMVPYQNSRWPRGGGHRNRDGDRGTEL